MKKIKPWLIGFLILLALPFLLMLFPWIHVPKTVQFDASLPYTEINGYKYHMEVFGKPEAMPVIVVHGGPGIDYGHLKTLVPLSKDYRVIFYDQRGSGLSPRVDKKELTMESSLDDLHSIVEHFSNGKKVKLIGHSWGGMLVVGYLAKHPERVSQAVVVEPGPLNPEAAKVWIENFNHARSISLWAIAPYLMAYPFVVKEDGQEGYDYVVTQASNERIPGPPYECAGQTIPADMFKRSGYESFNSLLKPMFDNPVSFTYDLAKGISEYHGDLMLISSECSILGTGFQEKYQIAKLPAQTVHVKTANMGHNLLTENAEWSLQTIGAFFKP
ncbi:MAG: alpha/beta hydrolase [Gallionella sp.]|nr:alpha/beta hydrolase [Gallionella sp.]